MLEYIRNIIPRIQQFSAQLSKEEVFVDKPWVLIDHKGNTHEYIFLRNHDLILSVNGKVIKGSWQLLPTGKLLIDRVTDKIMLQQAFIYDGILLLKMSGSDDLPFILLNESIVPDKDPERYLQKVEAKLLDYDIYETTEGIILNNTNSDTEEYNIDSILKYKNGKLVTGQIKSISKENYYCEVVNGVIKDFFYLVGYDTVYGIKIFIEQRRARYISIEDKIRDYSKLSSNVLINPFINNSEILKIEIDGHGHIIKIIIKDDSRGEFLLYLLVPVFIIFFFILIIIYRR
jgi:hypothetical protein